MPKWNTIRRLTRSPQGLQVLTAAIHADGAAAHTDPLIQAGARSVSLPSSATERLSSRDERRSDEAESALHTLADLMGFGDRSGLLVEIAEGLERYELPRLSATAFALAWTRTRGGGGWLSFGGKTEIELLQRATRLDPDATLSVVADEVERFILSDRFGSYGISQAIVFALATQALSVDDPLTAAFTAWDEARAVIERRAPVVHPSDFPKYPYENPTDDNGSEVIGDLSEAFALATAAGMAHPSRERKRRTLVPAIFELPHSRSLKFPTPRR